MFETTVGKLGRHNTHTLANTETGEHAVILSGAGATLNELTTQITGESTRVLDGYENEEDFTAHHPFRFKGAKLSPFPNRIRDGRYPFDGKNYQLAINFPSEGHAIHGLLYEAPFEEVKKWSTRREAGVELSHRFPGDAPGYPFPVTIKLRFVYKTNNLSCQTVVVNEGPNPMPLGDGWHPYLTTGSSIDDLQLHFPASHRIEVDTDRLPNGRSLRYDRFPVWTPLKDEYFDDCFRLEEGTGIARTALRDEKKRISLTVWQETGDEKYNYLQIYTPPERRSVALEPMTCPPDAFNNGLGLIRLDPEEQKSLSWGIEVSPT